jgi:hypothetical protein
LRSLRQEQVKLEIEGSLASADVVAGICSSARATPPLLRCQRKAANQP